MSLSWISNKNRFYALRREPKHPEYLAHYDKTGDQFYFINLNDEEIVLDRAAIFSAFKTADAISPYEIDETQLIQIIQKASQPVYSPFAFGIAGLTFGAVIIFCGVLFSPLLSWIVPLVIPICLGAGLCFLSYPYFLQNPNSSEGFRVALLLGSIIFAATLGVIAGSLIPAVGVLFGILISLDAGILTALALIGQDFYKKDLQVDYKKNIEIPVRFQDENYESSEVYTTPSL